VAEASDEPTYCELRKLLSYATKKEKGELVKDISSFANADLEALGGYRYMVFGVSNDGRVVGIETTSGDSLSAVRQTIVDTGIGMTGPEMKEYINQLSSSMHTQSYETNYGVGAKVAALTRNPEKLIYLSWKDGQGYMTHLWRDPRTGEYGLQQQERPDGTYAHWIDTSDDVKSELIQDHGTMVTLLGVSSEQSTVMAPEEALYPSRWITRYLNTRYFRLPGGITPKAIRPATGRQDLREQQAYDNVTGQDLIDDVVGRSLMADHKKSIRDRLKDLLDDLFNLKRYQRKAGGKHPVTDGVVRGNPPKTAGRRKRKGGAAEVEVAAPVTYTQCSLRIRVIGGNW
jgi:hypothetical protein